MRQRRHTEPGVYFVLGLLAFAAILLTVALITWGIQVPPGR